MIIALLAPKGQITEHLQRLEEEVSPYHLGLKLGRSLGAPHPPRVGKDQFRVLEQCFWVNWQPAAGLGTHWTGIDIEALGKLSCLRGQNSSLCWVQRNLSSEVRADMLNVHVFQGHSPGTENGPELLGWFICFLWLCSWNPWKRKVRTQKKLGNGPDPYFREENGFVAIDYRSSNWILHQCRLL